MSNWSASNISIEKNSIAILVASVLLFLSFFFTRNNFDEHPVTYTVIAKTEGSSGGKSSHLEWVFSLKDSAGKYSDRYVTFSVYSRFDVGSQITFNESDENEALGAFIRVIGGFIMIVTIICCIFE